MIPNCVELGRALVGGILAQAAAPIPAHQDTVLDMVVGSGSVVRAVLVILVAFSVGCWGIALAKSVEMRRARRQSERFIEIFWDAKNLAAIQTASVDLKESPVAQVFRGGYQELQRLTKAKRGNPGGDEDATEFGGIENVQRAMARARTQEVTSLERGLTFLATTASTAPFIGLFGTVWGIMTAFRGLSVTTSSSIQAVAPGIAAALVAGQEEQRVVTVGRAGQLFLNNTPMPPEQLTTKLAAIAAARPDRQLYVRADQAVPYGQVMRVMGAVHDAGLTRVGLVTEPPAERRR